jgi:hypothetical protein
MGPGRGGRIVRGGLMALALLAAVPARAELVTAELLILDAH